MVIQYVGDGEVLDYCPSRMSLKNVPLTPALLLLVDQLGHTLHDVRHFRAFSLPDHTVVQFIAYLSSSLGSV